MGCLDFMVVPVEPRIATAQIDHRANAVTAHDFLEHRLVHLAGAIDATGDQLMQVAVADQPGEVGDAGRGQADQVAVEEPPGPCKWRSGNGRGGAQETTSLSKSEPVEAE